MIVSYNIRTRGPDSPPQKYARPTEGATPNETASGCGLLATVMSHSASIRWRVPSGGLLHTLDNGAH